MTTGSGIDLLYEAIALLGEKQRVAQQLDVSPGAISNWLSQKRVPLERQTDLCKLLGRERKRGLDEPSKELREACGGSIKRTRLWAENAWCFMYIAAPSTEDSRSDRCSDLLVWRYWSGLRAHAEEGRSIVFSHWFTTSTSPSHQGVVGFLADIEEIDCSPRRVVKVSGSLRPEDGAKEGGYYVRVPNGVQVRVAARERDDSTKAKPSMVEFAGFTPAVPAETVNLCISLPKDCYEGVEMCRTNLSYEMIQGLGDIFSGKGSMGEFDDFIAPNGERLLAHRWRRARPEIADRIDALSPEESVRIPQDFFDFLNRDCIHVEARAMDPLLTLVAIWKLPWK